METVAYSIFQYYQMNRKHKEQHLFEIEIIRKVDIYIFSFRKCITDPRRLIDSVTYHDSNLYSD